MDTLRFDNDLVLRGWAEVISFTTGFGRASTHDIEFRLEEGNFDYRLYNRVIFTPDFSRNGRTIEGVLTNIQITQRIQTGSSGINYLNPEITVLHLTIATNRAREVEIPFIPTTQIEPPITPERDLDYQNQMSQFGYGVPSQEFPTASLELEEIEKNSLQKDVEIQDNKLDENKNRLQQIEDF